MANEMNLIDLHDAQVRRAGRIILAVDEFHWAQGESLALLGPNGAGKSTLVQLVTREAQPLHRDEPPVRFMGKDRATLAEVRNALGIVSATMHDQIRVHLPALDIVLGGLYGSLGVPQRVQVKPFQRDRCLAVMEELGIASLAERDIMTLSSGQARRVLIARALANDPQALIMDEPCTGLDPEGMFYVRRAMRTIAQHGKATLLVTHYAEDIIPEIERVVLLSEGTIVADGPKAELLTGDAMTSLFGVPLEVLQTGNYYALAGRY